MSQIRRIESIVVGPRYRRDMGDIDSLAKSIAEVGLLHPIVITPHNELIAGQRRLMACRQLGWTDVPVTVVGLDELLRGEWAENAERKDFTPTEAIAIGRELEERVRERSLQRRNGQLIHQPRSGESPERGDTRDIVGRAVGMGGHRYEQAKAVVQAAEEDADTFGQLAAEMDATGKVEPVFRKVREMQSQRTKPDKSAEGTRLRREQVAQMAREGYRVELIAERLGIHPGTVRSILGDLGIPTVTQKVGPGRRIDSGKVMDALIENAIPPEQAVAAIDWDVLDDTRLREWDRQIGEVIGAFTKIRNQLRKRMEVAS